MIPLHMLFIVLSQPLANPAFLPNIITPLSLICNNHLTKEKVWRYMPILMKHLTLKRPPTWIHKYGNWQTTNRDKKLHKPKRRDGPLYNCLQYRKHGIIAKHIINQILAHGPTRVIYIRPNPMKSSQNVSYPWLYKLRRKLRCAPQKPAAWSLCNEQFGARFKFTKHMRCNVACKILYRI